MEKKQVYLLNYVVEPNQPNQRPVTVAFLSVDKMYEYIKLTKLRIYQITSIDLVDYVEDSSETTDN